MDGYLNGLAVRAIPPARTTKPQAWQRGWTSRPAEERSGGRVRRRSERSVATKERSFASGGGGPARSDERRWAGGTTRWTRESPSGRPPKGRPTTQARDGAEFQPGRRHPEREGLARTMPGPTAPALLVGGGGMSAGAVTGPNTKP